MKKIEKLKLKLNSVKEDLNKRGVVMTEDSPYYYDSLDLIEEQYKRCVENVYHDDFDSVVCNYDIYESLIEGISHDKLIEEIIEHVSLKEGADLPTRTSVELSELRLGDNYTVDELEDAVGDWLSNEYGYCHYGFAYEVNGNHVDIAEIDWDTSEALGNNLSLVQEEENLEEGTSNFASLEYFPLLVFYKMDEFYDMMKYDPDYPDEADFEEEDPVDGHVFTDDEAYWAAIETFEENYWDKNNVCVLDEDDEERLEERLYEFNEESKNLAYEADVDENGEQAYGPNLSLEDVEVKVEPGYYEGHYIYVENEDYLEGLEKEFKKQQFERFEKFFEELRKEFGLTKLGVAWGPASNGETGYKIINDSLKEKKKKEKVHATIGGDPEKTTAFLNHALNTGDVPVGPLGESKEEGRVEFCLMKDGDNVDCYDSEEEAIKNARELAKELSDRGLDNKGVRVLLVRYGPKDEHGDEPELGCENIWAVHFDESLKEDKELKEYNLPKDAKPYKTCGNREYYIATFDDVDRAMMGNKATHTVVTKRVGGDFDLGSASGLDFDSEEKAKAWIDRACKYKEESLNESMKSEVTKWWQDVEDANIDMKWGFHIDNGDYDDIESMHSAMFDMLIDLKEKGAKDLFNRGKKIYNKYAKGSPLLLKFEESAK